MPGGSGAGPAGGRVGGPGGRPADVFARAARLREEGVPFVLATVVRAERPTSARPGAKAIVLEGGEVRGFVGGTCVRPAVRRESLRALADGAPRLLRISPDALPEGTEAEEGVLAEHMACVSGGALDIHLEPFLPARRLLLAGSSPVVESLAALGGALGLEVRSAEPAGGEAALAEASAGAFVVVAGHGEGEWAALKAGLGAKNARYVGLVASPRRAAAVRERLAGMGLSAQEIAPLRSPAGLDLGAESPGEIAVSILAEIVEIERRGKRADRPPAPDAAGPAPAAAPEVPAAAAENPTVAEEPPAAGGAAPVGISLGPTPERRDPICGMTVSADSPHRLTRDGETFFFCCAGCRETFAAARPA